MFYLPMSRFLHIFLFKDIVICSKYNYIKIGIQEKYDISLIKLVSYSLITKFQISIENISEDNVTMK